MMAAVYAKEKALEMGPIPILIAKLLTLKQIEIMIQELSIAERLAIYELALALTINYHNSGLCMAMKYAMIKLKYDEYDHSIPWPHYNLEMFPEVYSHKPKTNQIYWFKQGEWKPREKILKAAIKECKKLLKTKTL